MKTKLRTKRRVDRKSSAAPRRKKAVASKLQARRKKNDGGRMGITDIFKGGGNKPAAQQQQQDTTAKKPEPKKANKHAEAPPEPELSPELLAMSPEERAKHMAPPPKKEEPTEDATKSQVLAPPTASMTASVGMGSKVRIVQEVNLLELINNMDKLQAEILALKEIKFQSDEKAKQISEGLGELRAMVFQRDAIYKENDAKLGKMEVIVNEIQPQVIMAAIQKREREVNEVRARIEKNDSILQVNVEQIRNMQKELEHVRGVARVLEADKKITEIIPKIEESKSTMERLSAKSERLYFEIDKRLSEFAVFKEKVVTIEQLTHELMKMADESKVKLDGCGSKDEVLSLRAEVGKLGAGLEAMKKQIEGLRASGTIVTPNALMSMPFTPLTTQGGGGGPAPQGADGTSVEALRAQKEEIKALLSMLEDEYREGVISEKTFAEARMKNESHLKELEHMIEEKQSGKQQGISPPPTKEEEYDKEEKTEEPHQATKPEPPKENTSPPQEQPPAAQKQPEESKNITIHPEVGKNDIEPPTAQQEENKSSHPSESAPQQQQHQLIVDESLSDLEEILSLINNTGKLSKQKRDLEKMLETVKKQHAKGLVSDDSYYNIVKSTNEQIENREGMLKRVSNLPLILSLSKKELMHLKHRKLELESLMKMLEHQLSDGVIAEKTYNDTRFSTTRRLDEIQAKMSVLSKVIESAHGGATTKSKEDGDTNKPAGQK